MLELKYIKTKASVQEALNNGNLRGQLRSKAFEYLKMFKTNDPEHIAGTHILNLFRCLYYNRKAFELDAITQSQWHRLQQSVTSKLWRMEFHKSPIFICVYNKIYMEWKREEAKKLVKEEVIKEFFNSHPEYDNNDEEINERSLRT